MEMVAKQKISVITVNYNDLPALRVTAQSVLGQDYSELEYLVIDGASTDGSIPWLIQSHIAYISQSDKGIYDAMNKGVQHAQGDWIIFMNAGDTFASPSTISKIASHLPVYPAMVYGDIYTNLHGTFICKKAHKAGNCHRMFCCHQAIVAHHSLLQQFPFVLHHPYSADLYWIKTLYQQHIPMLYIPEVIAYFDHNGISNRHRLDALKDNIEVVKELDNGWEKYWFLTRLYFVMMCHYASIKLKRH